MDPEQEEEGQQDAAKGRHYIGLLVTTLPAAKPQGLLLVFGLLVFGLLVFGLLVFGLLVAVPGITRRA